MQSLEEFSANKSCPELSPDGNLLSDLLDDEDDLSINLHRPHSYPLLGESEFDSSSYDLNDTTMTTTQDDAIEILSCHVEPDDEDIPSRSVLVPFKIPNGEMSSDDPASRHRKRVVRAVGVVTFLLLLFSIILIGISLNMSKDIDEMVLVKEKQDNYGPAEDRSLRQSTMSMRNPQPNFTNRKVNLTTLDEA